MVVQKDVNPVRHIPLGDAPEDYFTPTVANHTRETHVDESWREWDALDALQDDWEQLDIPHAASRLTLELRWRLLQLRYRNDRYIKISDVMARRHKRRMDVYRKSYRAILQNLKMGGRGSLILPGPCNDNAAAELLGASYLDFVSARHQRDWLHTFHDDAYKRRAKLYNRIKMKDEMKHYWKQDWFYMTKWEKRRNMVSTAVKVHWYAIKLPVVFGFYRVLLHVLEHASLLLDWKRAQYRAYRLGLQPLRRRSRVAEAQQREFAKAAAGKDRKRTTGIMHWVGNARGGAVLQMLNLLFFGVLLYTVRVIILEGQTFRFLLPEEERVAALERDYRYSHPEDRGDYVAPPRFSFRGIFFWKQ